MYRELTCPTCNQTWIAQFYTENGAEEAVNDSSLYCQCGEEGEIGEEVGRSELIADAC